MAIIKPEEMDQNVAQAPTLGRTAGSISQGGGGQRRNVSQRGSGFTNLQQYVTANENNANPEIVRQRTAQAGTGLQQAQTGFENVAQQARTGLQGIQGVNTFVRNVLRDPTAAASNQANLQRFQALRTGTERIANPTDVLQPFTQAQAGFGSQREQLASGLRTDTTGTGLQRTCTQCLRRRFAIGPSKRRAWLSNIVRYGPRRKSPHRVWFPSVR
jgi:hypothetical protein